jgi:iron complex outermembrane receptor protein
MIPRFSPRPCAWPRLSLAPAAFLGAFVLGALVTTSGVAAQAVPDSAVTLDSLEVTILRSPTAMGRIPYAVDVATETELRLGKTGTFIEEALGGLAGVQVQNRFNFAVGERLAIRGFGARAQFGVRGVKILVDGIPATMPDGQSSLDHLDLGTLGRAEVLRGPGSALYGNAAGGVLTLQTRAPPTGVRQEATVVGGSNGLLDVDAITSGTVGQTGYVLGVGRMEYGGFRADPTTEGAEYGSADRLHLNGQITRPLGRGLLRVTVNAMDLDAENPGSISAADLEAGTDARRFNVLQRTGKEVGQEQIGASWQGTSFGGETEVAVWGLHRSVVNPIPTDIIDLDRKALGLRALIGGGNSDDAGGIRWSSGLELEAQYDDRTNQENDAGEPTTLTLDQEERVLSAGLFGRLAVRLQEHVEASASVRYDRVGFKAEDQFFSGGDPDDSGSRTLSAWSPSVGIVADVSPNATIWANVATSLETPTTTELVNRPDGSGGFNPELDPQRSTGVEIGARGRISERFSYDVTLFRTWISDELVSFQVPSQAGRDFYRNAGKSLHEGIEANVQADLDAGVVARATWSRIDARYETFETEDDDFSGNRIPGLAPYRVSGLLKQERDQWFWALEGQWTGEIPTDDGDTESAPSYELVHVRAGLKDIRLGGGVAVTPFVGLSNLFNESYVTAVTVNAFGGRYYEPGPGRTVHFGATVAWTRQ